MSLMRVRSWLCVVLLALLAVIGLAVVHAAPALADSSADISVSADNPPPPAVPTGQPSTYTINFTCSAVIGNSCGSNPTITIPLDVTSSNPATPDPSTWAYSTASTISGLITSQQVVGGNLVITLDETKLAAGQSDTIQLSVTPPNNITPDGTTWEILPSFQTDDIPAVTAPTPAEGAATAAALLSVSKNTNDGGAVYVVGNNVIFNVAARCNPGGASGNLYLTDGSLVDNATARADVRVGHAGADFGARGGHQRADHVELPRRGLVAGGLRGGCERDDQLHGDRAIAPGTPDNTSLTNTATFQGTPIGTTTPQSSTAPRTLTAITSSPGNAGNFLGKSALGPLSIPGFGYDATYAGNWITPINPRPSPNPGSAEGQYTVNISYPASRAFTTDLADPVPCLDNHSGIVYSSSSPSGDDQRPRLDRQPLPAPRVQPDRGARELGQPGARGQQRHLASGRDPARRDHVRPDRQRRGRSQHLLRRADRRDRERRRDRAAAGHQSDGRVDVDERLRIRRRLAAGRRRHA